MKVVRMPHPVLKTGGSDYAGGRFEMKVDNPHHTVDGNIVVPVRFTLESKFVDGLVRGNKAGIFIVVKCTKTYRRETIPVKDMKEELRLPLSEYSDKIQLSPYVVAMNPIEGFSSGEHHKEFDGVKIDIPAGAVLACGGHTELTIDSLQTISSAIHLVTNNNLEEGEYVFDVEEDIIKIAMCDKTRCRVNALRRTNIGVLYPSIYVAAVTHAIQNVTTDGTKKWEEALRKTLESKDMRINDDLKDNAYWHAQKLLNYPINHMVGTDDTDG